jgi:PQQ-like domain
VNRRDGLSRALADTPVPAADAAARRARRVVLDAFASLEPTPVRHRRSTIRLALGVACAVLLVGVAAASPGASTIGHYVRDAVRRDVVATKAVPIAPLRLPGGGSLLVRSAGSLFVVHADGSHLLLGHYREAAWSPHARFIVATSGPHLVVLDPHSGQTRWSITAASNVHGARWSLEPTVPPCCRVAYLTGDGELHVIAGDGTGNRVLARADARVAPAWRPRSHDRALAYVTPAGDVRVISADDGHLIARIARGFRPTRLAWSSDGERLLAMSASRLVVVDVGDRSVVRMLAARAGGRLASAAFVGRGRAIVVLQRLDSGRSQVELLPVKGRARSLETLVGALAGLAPAPDGRSVLVGWGAADEWLLVPTTGRGTTRRVTGLGTRLGAAPIPLVDAWHSTG